MSVARFVVGIDLGTSNSAVAYADLEETRKAGRPIIRELEVPQLVAPGDVQTRRLLPSSLYAPAGFEMGAEQRQLPWGQAENVVGEAAKRLGAKTPVRLVESAKSWLCHGGVNRTAPILPWHAPDDVPKMSPVEAAAAYLGHIKDAWDFGVADGDTERAFEKQHIVITVPASFDEVSRRLTVEAATKAGLPDVTLIEEPLAAFYAFIARTGGTPRTTGLSGGERVLIADVGGGTTDFTLVDVKAPADGEADGVLGFERTAVGDHLLLGGDNMDLALAHAMEPKLAKKKKLDAEGWAQLKLECRLAKETLFTHPDKDALPIVVTGKGSKVVGGTLRTELTQSELSSLVIDGYFPPLPAGEAAKPARPRAAGFSEYGLPYAQDAGITRHLAAFLMKHAAPGEPFAHVDAILFNGGALKPVVVRDRLSEVLGGWMRATSGTEVRDPRPLEYDVADDAFEVAVARGAAYFGLVREGLGVRVGGGSPREYFLEVGDEDGAEPPQGRLRVLCIAPRGMMEGQRIEVPDRDFNLVTNRPVEFPLYSSTSPRTDPVGAVVEIEAEDLHTLPPLQTVVKFGKQKAGTKVPVRLQSKLTEVGTLEISCFSRMSGARFKLELDLRAKTEADPDDAPSEAVAKNGTRTPPESSDISAEQVEAAKARIVRTFQREPPRGDPDGLMKGLEEDLGEKRDALPFGVLRSLSEHLLELMDERGISPAHEARWLNLIGFTLRPGFGVPLDDWRCRQLWKIHSQGVLHPSHDPCELNWWILWRRTAGGLGRGHQEELASRAFPMVIPSLMKRAKKKPPKTKSQEAVEVWRAAASLEQISPKSRAQLGDALMVLLEEKKAQNSALWCLGRIGARRLLYGPREATVRAVTAADWAKRLMALPKPPKGEPMAAALVPMCRLTGDRQLDLEEALRKKVAAHLKAAGASESDLRPLFEVVQVDEATQGVAFGEGLPVGLTLT